MVDPALRHRRERGSVASSRSRPRRRSVPERRRPTAKQSDADGGTINRRWRTLARHRVDDLRGHLWAIRYRTVLELITSQCKCGISARPGRGKNGLHGTHARLRCCKRLRPRWVESTKSC